MAELVNRQTVHLFVASREGILAIECDRGEAQIQPWGLYGSYTTCLHTDDKGVLLAAGTATGVAITADGGDNWREATGLPEGGRVRVLGGDGGAVYAGLSPATVLRSDDGGASFLALTGFAGPWSSEWRPAAAEEATRVSAIIARGSRLIVGVADGGVLVSESGGDAFRKVGDGLPAAVVALALPAGSDEDVIAGTTSGLHRTSKLGASGWRHVYTPRARTAVTAIAIDPGESQRIIIAASRAISLAKPGNPVGADTELHLSSDGGTTWSTAKLGKLKVLRGIVTSLVIAPNQPARIFAGTSVGEILESRDGGASFELIAASLPGVNQLAAGPSLGG